MRAKHSHKRGKNLETFNHKREKKEIAPHLGRVVWGEIEQCSKYIKTKTRGMFKFSVTIAQKISDRPLKMPACVLNFIPRARGKILDPHLAELMDAGNYQNQKAEQQW